MQHQRSPKTGQGQGMGLLYQLTLPLPLAAIFLSNKRAHGFRVSNPVRRQVVYKLHTVFRRLYRYDRSKTDDVLDSCNRDHSIMSAEDKCVRPPSV